MAVTMAVGAARPSPRRFTQAASGQTRGIWLSPSGLVPRFPGLSSRLCAIAPAWPSGSLSAPGSRAMRRTFLAPVPVAPVSAVAETGAPSARWHLASTSSGKKDPLLVLGILRSSVPAQAMGFPSRQPFRLVPVSSHSCPASASTISFAMLSASCLGSSRMLVVPSANPGISVDAGATVGGPSATLSIGPSPFPRIRFVAISDPGTMAPLVPGGLHRSRAYANKNDAIA